MFSITLYRNSAEPNRVDKSDYLTTVQTISGVLREETSILAPIIKLELSSRPNANYCYIPQFGRYYYITDIVSIRNNLWELTLSVDVLMSHKEAILSSKGFVERNEFASNPLLIDKKRVIEQGYDIETHEVENDVFVDYPETDTDTEESDIIGTELFYVLNGYKIKSAHELA